MIRAVLAAALFCACSAIVVANVGAATAPTVTLSPSGPYHSGETVKLSVGPNSLFTPGLRVNIIECADPGGTAANLPTSVKSCDGNTIQGDTIIIGHDGSFSESSYTLFSLPNQAFFENNTMPVCSQTASCVLYVGMNQEDFTQAKVFSAPFTVDSSPGSATTAVTGGGGQASATEGGTASGGSSTTSGTGSATSTGEPSVSASVSLGGASSLAFTGIPPALWTVAFIGAALLAVGTAGRRLLRRRP